MRCIQKSPCPPRYASITVAVDDGHGHGHGHATPQTFDLDVTPGVPGRALVSQYHPAVQLGHQCLSQVAVADPGGLPLPAGDVLTFGTTRAPAGLTDVRAGDRRG